MLEYSIMQMMQSRKGWFWRMWTLALLAVFGLVASPVLASTCCCGDMVSGLAEAGHSHSSPAKDAQNHAVGTHQKVAQVAHSRSAVQVSGAEVCRPTTCEVAPLTLNNSDTSKSFSFAPLAAAVVKPFALQAPNTLSVSTFASRVAMPRAPDRASCSGLSPPAPSRS